jgi:hypothetical protein
MGLHACRFGGWFKMKNEWLLIGILCFYCLVFIVCFVTAFRDLRTNRKHACRGDSKPFDLDRFCADFSRDDRVKDPFVLINDRWVDQSYPQD